MPALRPSAGQAIAKELVGYPDCSKTCSFAENSDNGACSSCAARPRTSNAKQRSWSRRPLEGPHGILIIDGSRSPWRNTCSAGVAHQYCAHLGKVANWRRAAFAAYHSVQGTTLVACRFHLPEHWFDDDHQTLRDRCGVPQDLYFAAELPLALQMVRTLCMRDELSFSWVLGGETYGADPNFLDGVSLAASTALSRCPRAPWSIWDWCMYCPRAKVLWAATQVRASRRGHRLTYRSRKWPRCCRNRSGGCKRSKMGPKARLWPKSPASQSPADVEKADSVPGRWPPTPCNTPASDLARDGVVACEMRKSNSVRPHDQVVKPHRAFPIVNSKILVARAFQPIPVLHCQHLLPVYAPL